MSGKLEIDMQRGYFESNVKQQTHSYCEVLTSTDTIVQERYCVAKLHDGALYLTPIESVYQLRPTLSHLDDVDDRLKEAEKTDSWIARQQLVRHPFYFLSRMFY